VEDTYLFKIRWNSKKTTQSENYRVESLKQTAIPAEAGIQKFQLTIQLV